MMDIKKLLEITVESTASDLHIRVGEPPIFRIDGRLVRQSNLPEVTEEDSIQMLKQITNQDQLGKFYSEKELDFAFILDNIARFRVNALWHRKTISLACRMLTLEVPTIDELELPQICKELILQPRGLILVTGPTGMGKSTTMAAMLRHLNENKDANVICIEDPIEYVHPNIKSFIIQRELGEDTKSFSTALTRALRHDPNVIVVGEMRDLDTISTAITAAETGHLVMSTLHTIDATQTFDRMIDIFPSHQQNQIRVQLSQEIIAVLSQTLVPKASGKGMIAAFEIVLANTAIRHLIRENRAFEIPSYIHLHEEGGMQSLDDALVELIITGKINREDALLKTSNPKRLLKKLEHHHYFTIQTK
jgi:twitching motility protein PilT